MPDKFILDLSDRPPPDVDALMKAAYDGTANMEGHGAESGLPRPRHRGGHGHGKEAAGRQQPPEPPSSAGRRTC